MKKTRLWTTATASLAILTAGVVIATPAYAAATGTITPNSDGTATVTYASNGEIVTLFICPAATVGCNAAKAAYNMGPGFLPASPVTVAEGVQVFVISSIGPGSLPAGDYVLTLSGNSTTVIDGDVAVSIVGGGGTPSDSAPSAPVEASLSLDLAASGASCTSGSAATGLVGTWLALPGADDCTSTTTPSAKLLGWATRADFPVAIAQRQIDNGWGAYELFNDEGRMTAVFIPAGGATFVSAGNTLHPIWAS